jgi:hypothetical protein
MYPLSNPYTLAGSLCTYPLDVIRLRLAVDKRYTGMLQVRPFPLAQPSSAVASG